MSLKSYVKAHAPKSLLPLIKSTYRTIAWPVRKITRPIKLHQVQKKASLYLPYYQDELSREILADRLQFLRTGDINIFLDRAEKTGMNFHGIFYYAERSGYCFMSPEGSKYSGLIVIYDNEGSYFRYVKRLLSSCDWKDKYRFMALTDFLNGAEVSDTEMIIPVLTSSGHKKLERGRNVNAYINNSLLHSSREDLQYFDVFSPVDDEIVVDAGSYDGKTAIQFLKWGKGKVKHVYSFEFDPDNAVRCEENLKPYADKITLVKKGTWDKDEVLHVNPSGTSGSTIRSEGSTAVYLTSIDNVVKDEHVTFIKMDIEGAELKSLMGARNAIIKNHPRLAICVYHKDSDLYEIPGYILSLVPEYKFYLRHYSSCPYETVLYAYCD